MVSALWSWFVGLFTKEKIGILFVMLFKGGTSAVAKHIADKNLHRKALEFVKELSNRADLTSAEKAKLFNEKLLRYAKELGIVLCDSVVNCLRELAVNALKAKQGI